MATYINHGHKPMIVVYTRVLNGLPIRAEGNTKLDHNGDLSMDGVQLYWTKKSKNPFKPFNRATVIESKMNHNDWEMVEEDLMDVAMGRWIA